MVDTEADSNLMFIEWEHKEVLYMNKNKNDMEFKTKVEMR